MSQVFQRAPDQPPNGFDHLVVDVADLHRRHPVEHPAALGIRWDGPFERFYAAPFLPLAARGKAWHLLRRTRLDLTWFDRFRRYWGQALGGRPLWGAEDFYFLRNLYRMRFQQASVPDTADASVHLAAWQRPEVLSHLFHSVYKESLQHELRVVRLLHQLHRGPVRKILEFGCGSAPVTTTFCEFQQRRDGLEMWISDLESISFHYAASKLASIPAVHAVPLRAATSFRFPEGNRFDAIFCLTVLEHLQDPLATVGHLHGLLAPDGLLFFDYVKSDAGGLDTRAGLEQRPAVFDYVRQHFRVRHGELDVSRSLGLTVVEPK